MIDKDYLINNGVDLNSAIEFLGDLSFYNKTLQAFLEENEKRVPQIEKFREECNMTDYAILVHSLKSDAKYLGFNKLADISEVHELASKENKIDEVNAKYKDLHDEIERCTTIATTYLNSGRRTKKIIVADESIVISSVVEKAFEGEYEVIVASDGGEAIKIVQNNVYDDIVGLILDLNMPEIDGFAVLDYFKANNLFSKIPVYIITGEVEEEKIEKARTYDIIDIIPKPFTIENVRKAMDNVVNNK